MLQHSLHHTVDKSGTSFFSATERDWHFDTVNDYVDNDFYSAFQGELKSPISKHNRDMLRFRNPQIIEMSVDRAPVETNYVR